MAPRAAPRASLAGLASLDSLDDLPASSEFIEQELVVDYALSKGQARRAGRPGHGVGS
jgi:hypothetical protein